MFGILIAALDSKGNGVSQVIGKLKSKGYTEQDISIITKINNQGSSSFNKRHSDLALPQKTGELDNLLSQAQVFPNLGGLLITGPVAPAINYISSEETLENEEDAQSSLFALLVSIGIPHEDAFYFTDIVEQGGFIIILPEFGDLTIYEILWNYGADRILVLEEDFPATPGII